MFKNNYNCERDPPAIMPIAITWTTTMLMLLSISVSIVHNQVPSFGGCPVYEPMSGFELERFMGTWFEIERFFTVTELASRCISASYERHSDSLIWVNNSVTNRL